MKNNKYFHRIWWRYVDDIFAVIKERYMSKILEFINSQSPFIQFTYEIEKDDTLPFLDLEIKKSENGELKFGIYRKPTHMNAYITNDLYHPGEHKKAAFLSMMH